ncbi:MAG: MFS transporter [Elusimicrobia bacterium]|nr:MFS transporter [Elusimicrobiota bacterium]
MRQHLERTLRSLKYRDFRLYFIGMVVSMTGTWMQIMAQMWLVYRLTRSPFMLGLVGFAGSAPALFLGLFGSIAADRWGRRRLLLATQALCFVQAAVLAALTMSGLIQIWHIFVLAFLLGLVTVFDMPARQAFVADLVDKPDMGNAIALNSSLLNISRMVGPTLAGFLVSLYGEGVCFLINAGSYLAVLTSLLLMHGREAAVPAGATDSPWLYMRRGLSYAFGRPDMGAMLVQLSVLSLAGVPFLTLIPVFADQVFASGSQGAGLLMGAMGVGAVAGSLLLARKESLRGLPALAGAAGVAFGAGIVMFSFSGGFWPAAAAMALVGWSMMTAFAASNTLLQTLAAEEMRGRIMALFSFTFMGTAPAGNFLIGAAAERLGAPAAVCLGGLVCLASSWFYFRRMPMAVPERHPAHGTVPVPEDLGGGLQG